MVLISTYIFLTVLITLTAGFALSSVSELSHATRYRDSTKAFWAAEGGIHNIIQDPSTLNSANLVTESIGGLTVYVTKDQETDPSFRIVTATATVNNHQRQIRIRFPALAPDAFDNTIASGGNLYLTGTAALLDIQDKTSLSGEFRKQKFRGLFASFDELYENVDSSLTTLTIPDQTGNLDEDLDDLDINTSSPDEFVDYVQFYRDIYRSYPESERVYFQIQEGEVIEIRPNDGYSGKKVIFVEGIDAEGNPAEGAGDVEIVFSGTPWTNDENLTIVSTGSVHYTEPLEFGTENSYLNVVTWENYQEDSYFLGKHSGTIYSHDSVHYESILDLSVTKGCVIANNSMETYSVITGKRFSFDDPVKEGVVPPGFEGLIGGGQTGYQDIPISWEEI